MLLLLFLVVPFVELYVLIKVGSVLGVLNTIAVVLLVSVVGAWLVKREGLKTLRRIQSQLDQLKVPTDELLDGGLIMLSGALMLTPGFVTDIVAIALLLPPIRKLVRRQLKARYGKRFSLVDMGGVGGVGAETSFGSIFTGSNSRGPFRSRRGPIIDVESEVDMPTYDSDGTSPRPDSELGK